MRCTYTISKTVGKMRIKISFSTYTHMAYKGRAVYRPALRNIYDRILYSIASINLISTVANTALVALVFGSYMLPGMPVIIPFI